MNFHPPRSVVFAPSRRHPNEHPSYHAADRRVLLCAASVESEGPVRKTTFPALLRETRGMRICLCLAAIACMPLFAHCGSSRAQQGAAHETAKAQAATAGTSSSADAAPALAENPAPQPEKSAPAPAENASPSTKVLKAWKEPEYDPPVLTLRLSENNALDFVLVPAGTFKMGNPDHGSGGALAVIFELTIGHGSGKPDDAGPVRRTTISRRFYLARTKTTVAQYCEFLNSIEDPDKHIVMNDFKRITRNAVGRFVPIAGFEKTAVNTVPWSGAVAYCRWLSERTGLRCRLPTEAEWELAARGPESRLFPWGNKIDAKAKYGDTSGAPVGEAPANATPLGILDMVGPTAEWCSDLYLDRYDPEDRVDPQGPDTAERTRVLRGRYKTTYLRLRQFEDPFHIQSGFYGLRVLIETGQ